jgi:hypothetical protein
VGFGGYNWSGASRTGNGFLGSAAAGRGGWVSTLMRCWREGGVSAAAVAIAIANEVFFGWRARAEGCACWRDRVRVSWGVFCGSHFGFGIVVFVVFDGVVEDCCCGDLTGVVTAWGM